MSEFDVRFAAYEKAMHANNNFGLQGEALAEQYGRYALGLQHDQIKADNKKVGREFAKEIAEKRKNNKALTDAIRGKRVPFQGTSQEAMRRLHGIGEESANTRYYRALEAEQGAGFQGTSQEAMRRLHGIGEESANTHYYRALEAEQGAGFRGTSQEAMRRLHGIGEESANTKFYRTLEQTSIDNGAWKNEHIGVNQNPIKNGAEYERFWAEEMDKKYGPVNPQPDPQPNPNPVKKKGLFGKIGDWFSKNGKTFKKMGKFVGLAALFGALGAGIYFLTKKDNKVNEIPPEQTVIIPAEEQEPQVEEVPNVEEKPEIDAKQEQVETFALKGSDYWKYAEFELIAEHQGEVGYVPSNSEINERMREIMERKNIKFAEDGIHSKPILKTGDEVEVREETAKLLNEAIKQLKEEHKDNPKYEPTYREVQRKFKQIIAEKQAA